ncbi:hypothetical protein [Bradyrhizobium sp. USDA 10063]
MPSSYPYQLELGLPRRDEASIAGVRARPLGRRLLDLFLIGIGCLAFIAASNLTSDGNVTLDSLGYWFLGLVPFALIILSARASRGRRDDWFMLDEGFLVSAWMLSLLLFVALRVSSRSETFEFPLYEFVRYNLVAGHLVLSFIYSAFGCVAAFAIGSLVRRDSWALASPREFVASFFFVAATFFVLVFLIHDVGPLVRG